MEEKTAKWNLKIPPSVADEFEKIRPQRRGGKQDALTAALLMFLAAPQDERQRYINIVREAEDEEGTVHQIAMGKLGKHIRPRRDAAG